VVSAVVAGHVKGAADALAKSLNLQDEWGATPLGKTGRLSHPCSPFDATGKRWKRRGRWAGVTARRDPPKYGLPGGRRKDWFKWRWEGSGL